MIEPSCRKCKNLRPTRCIKYNDKHEFTDVYWCKFCKGFVDDIEEKMLLEEKNPKKKKLSTDSK